MTDSEVDLFNAIVFEDTPTEDKKHEHKLEEQAMLLFARQKFEGI